MAMMQHVLEVQTGKYKGRRIKIVDEVIIGRDESAKIRIGSGEVSRQHCLLKASGQQLTVRDLESSNGTFVNGRPIRSETSIGPGDSVTVGPMTFRVCGRPSREVAPPPTGVAIGRQPIQDDGLSDDDIASWLADEMDSLPAGVGDTAIVSKGREAPSTSEFPAYKSKAPQPPPPRSQQFKTVAEEGRDIIRRYLEMRDGTSSDDDDFVS